MIYKFGKNYSVWGDIVMISNRWLIVLLIVIFITPIGLWLLLKYLDTSFFSTLGVNRADWLAFFCGYVGAGGTIFLGIVALYQNKSLENQNEKSLEFNKRLLELEEIDKMPVLTVKRNDVVCMNENEGYISMSINLYNNGKSPITVLRALNEVDNYVKSIAESSVATNKYVERKIEEILKFMEKLDFINKLGEKALVSNIASLKKFFVDLQENQEDESIVVFIKNYIEIIDTTYNYTHQMMSDLPEIKNSINETNRKLAEQKKIFDDLCVFKDFGKYILNDSCYIEVGDNVNREIKFPLLKNDAGIWVANLRFEFKNIYGSWYRENLDIEINEFDGKSKINTKLLVVEKISA